MPLSKLPDPQDPKKKLLGLGKAAPASSVLMSTLLAFNAAQTASTALIPFSSEMATPTLMTLPSASMYMVALISSVPLC